MTPLLARFEKAQPPRNLAAIKSRWHSLRSSVMRYTKKQKESYQSKAAARAPLLMAAILFFRVHEHKEFWSFSPIGSTFDSVSGTCCITVHTSFMASLQRFVPATCPMKFNKLNFVRHVAWTNIPRNGKKKYQSTRVDMHVAATYPGDMCPQHFHVCANAVMLSLLHIPAKRPYYMSPQCALHNFLFFVAGTCPYNMTPRVWPPWKFSSQCPGALFIRPKTSSVNFRKFPWANGTDFSSVENDKPHSFVRLEFFNDFEV